MAAVCLAFAGCGGGGGGDPAATTVTLTGSVHAGPVSGANVLAKTPDGATVAGPVTTELDGSFAIEVPSTALATDLLFEANGGTYDDEATGAPTACGRLAAYAPARSLAAGAAVHLGPATTVVADLIDRHGNTRYQANRSFTNAFGYLPDLAATPTNGTAAPHESRLAALRAGAFSQLTTDLGLGPERQFDLLAALSADLADGTLDGRNGATPVTLKGGGALPEDLQNRFEHALLHFLGSAHNHTGLQADEIGLLSFAKVALTSEYRVEYLPRDPGASLGCTPFQLQITSRFTGSPVPGLALNLQPVMHMATQQHSTPVGAVSDHGDGTYDCAVYYLMAGGDGWGYWRLNVILDDGLRTETVDFFPTVGSPSYAVLRGQADLVAGLGGGERRVYYLVDDGLVVESLAAGTYRFGLFIAAREDEWNYPALSTGLELHDQNGAAWTVATATVEFSLDGAAWTTMTDDGRGHWSVSGLSGLDPSASELALYVRLNVNGEQKTTDGTAETAANGSAQLVTGGASCCF